MIRKKKTKSINNKQSNNTHEMLKAFHEKEKAKMLEERVRKINEQEKKLHKEFIKNEKKPLEKIIKSCQYQIDKDLDDIKFKDIDI